MNPPSPGRDLVAEFFVIAATFSDRVALTFVSRHAESSEPILTAAVAGPLLTRSRMEAIKRAEHRSSMRRREPRTTSERRPGDPSWQVQRASISSSSRRPPTDLGPALGVVSGLIGHAGV